MWQSSSAAFRSVKVGRVILLAAVAVFLYFFFTRTISRNDNAKSYDVILKTLGMAPKTHRAQEGQSAVNIYKSDEDVDHHCTYYRLPGKADTNATLCVHDPKVDAVISGHVLKHHTAWDAELVTATMVMMREADGSSSSHDERPSLVDLGCNIGVYTVTAAALGFGALGVDTNEINLKLLATSLRANKLTSLVTLVYNALSDRHEDVILKMRNPISIGSLFVQSAGTEARPGNGSATTVVKTILMDDLIPHMRTRRVFVKMDIEGHEGLALRGAHKFFDHAKIICVLMEWGVVKKKADDRDFILDFMAQRGYEAFASPRSKQPLKRENSMSWPGNVYWMRR